jgi:hypothetical protein
MNGIMWRCVVEAITERQRHVALYHVANTCSAIPSTRPEEGVSSYQ